MRVTVLPSRPGLQTKVSSVRVDPTLDRGLVLVAPESYRLIAARSSVDSHLAVPFRTVNALSYYELGYDEGADRATYSLYHHETVTTQTRLSIVGVAGDSEWSLLIEPPEAAIVVAVLGTDKPKLGRVRLEASRFDREGVL
jgi:hypothetical protein